MDISVSDDNWGTWHHRIFTFWVAQSTQNFSIKHTSCIKLLTPTLARLDLTQNKTYLDAASESHN